MTSPSDKAYITEQRVNLLISGVDTWHNLGAMSNGWTNTRARYMSVGVAGLVIVDIVALVPSATIADGTVIWSAANGFPAAYRTGSSTGRLPLYYAGGGGPGGECPSIFFVNDGSVQIFGFGGTTLTRGDGMFTFSTIA